VAASSPVPGRPASTDAELDYSPPHAKAAAWDPHETPWPPKPQEAGPPSPGGLPPSCDEAPTWQYEESSPQASMCQGPDAYSHDDPAHGSSSRCNEEVGDFPAQDEIPRPVGAPGRPSTRRNKDRHAHEREGQVPRGKKVVYVDHHHMHHHHHFHGPGDWGGPGNIPPEMERESLQLAAESDAERGRAPGQGYPQKSQSSVGGGRSMNSARGGSRMHSARGNTAGSARLGTAGSLRPTGPDAELIYTAEELFCRDAGWPATFSTSIGAGSNGSVAAPNAGKQLLPLTEYLSLVSQLAPQTRLKFSPYGVPRSARAAARTLANSGFDQQSTSRRLSTPAQFR